MPDEPNALAKFYAALTKVNSQDWQEWGAMLAQGADMDETLVSKCNALICHDPHAAMAFEQNVGALYNIAQMRNPIMFRIFIMGLVIGSMTMGYKIHEKESQLWELEKLGLEDQR